MHERAWDRGSLVEIGEAILLALVAVATAWDGVPGRPLGR